MRIRYATCIFFSMRGMLTSQASQLSPSFWYSQDDKACEDTAGSPNPLPVSDLPIPQFKVAGQPKDRLSPEPDLPTAKSSMQNTPRSRLRHDNSQIQFAVVESSPITERDSQLLTEHQREVRDRQK